MDSPACCATLTIPAGRWLLKLFNPTSTPLMFVETCLHPLPSTPLPPSLPSLNSPTPLPLPSVPPLTFVKMIARSYLVTCLIVLSLLSLIRAAPIFEEEASKKSRFLDGECQAPKTANNDPLIGCPKNTVFVSKHHPAAIHRSINSALSSL